LTLANREFAQLPQNRDKLPSFRAIRGRLFFGFFLLAKQKKETRHRRNPCNAIRALKNCLLVNKPISKMGDGAPLMRPYGEVGARSSETRAMPSGH
jgi:hypothetical protein